MAKLYTFSRVFGLKEFNYAVVSIISLLYVIFNFNFDAFMFPKNG